MSTITIKDEEELKKKFLEAVYIMHCMRQAQKRWHIEFGYQAKNQREVWEIRADLFLGELDIKNRDTKGSIKMEMEPKSESNELPTA